MVSSFYNHTSYAQPEREISSKNCYPVSAHLHYRGGENLKRMRDAYLTLFEINGLDNISVKSDFTFVFLFFGGEGLHFSRRYQIVAIPRSRQQHVFVAIVRRVGS